MINIVIYSRDRAMQLEACLRSFKKHFKEVRLAKVKIVYFASSEEYRRGYDKLIESYPEFSFSSQTTFRIDTLEGIDNEDNPYTMFLVDDIIFKSDFSLNDSIFGQLRNNESMMAISLRLHRNIGYCYATDKNVKIPRFVRDIKNEFVVWKWPGAEGDWGYALSLDGNIYNTKFIKRLITHIDFSNPNELESNLNNPQFLSKLIGPVYMCCYDGISKLINVPANRVQNTFNNRHEQSYTAEELNKRFLEDNEIISLRNITGMDNASVHCPLNYVFKKKEF